MAHHRSSVVVGWIRAIVGVVAIVALVLACSNPTSSDDTGGGTGNGGNGGGNGGVLFSEGGGLTHNGVTYTTIIVGTQEWMAENLRTATLNDGTTIENRTGTGSWGEVVAPAWIHYNNDADNDTIYGKLYSGYTATHPNIAPAEWRVPTIADWTTLISALGGSSLAGGRMKETGTERWQSPNTAADNSGGFSARPSGYLVGVGFQDLGAATTWWSSTDGTTEGEYLQGVSVNYNGGTATVSGGGYFMKNGYSIRLVRDVE